MKKQRVNLFLDPEIVEKAKIQAVVEKTSLSELVDKAISAYVKRREPILGDMKAE